MKGGSMVQSEAAVLEMFVIYDRPTDHPNHFVVRRWLVHHYPAPCEACTLHNSLEEARRSLPDGLTRVRRDVNDEQQIVETWL